MSRYAIEKFPNSQIIGIHLDVSVPEMCDIIARDCTKGGKSLQKVLMKINGVVAVSSHKQCLRITRGGAYMWEEILPTVLEVLKKELKIHDDLVEVQPYA